MATVLALGLLSAASLLLGAVATRLWRPPSLLVGMLTAFGSGALLAAVTVHLAGNVARDGQTVALAIGCLAGGLLFLLLERWINARGGFLRKTATTISYVRRHERRRMRDLLRSLGRLDVFEGQPDHVLGDLAEALVPVSVEAGTAIFHRGDPSHSMCVLAEGEVDLYGADPAESPTRVASGSAFGHLAFLAGGRHSMTAVAHSPVRFWRLPRTEFDQAVRNSASLSRAWERFLEGPAVRTYLDGTYGMDRDARTQWTADLVRAVHERVEVEPLADPKTRAGGDVESMLRRFPDFADLPDGELKLLAERVFVKLQPPGHTFFHHGDRADRIYMLDEGRITLVAGTGEQSRASEFHPGRIIGAYSFLAGGHHTATAVAATDVRVGVLRRRDLEAILSRCPRLNERIESWLRRTELSEYLHDRQGLDRQRASTWVGQALRSLRTGRLLPSIESVIPNDARPGTAPRAIGLGTLLDAMPESILVGAGLATVQPGGLCPLLAGVFLSNLPESLSASIGMREHGVRFRTVLGMWTGVVLAAGVSAVLANLLVGAVPGTAGTVLEALAAGAVLTMVAETMLPEAYARGGPLTGFATLAGFLTTIVLAALTAGAAVG